MFMVVDVGRRIEMGVRRCKCRQGRQGMILLEMAEGDYHDGGTSDDDDI